ncbi:MAG TPA: HupE/UreJ family protein [Steroidobacteraceae bacterium]|jgi:urease accessory protein
MRPSNTQLFRLIVSLAVAIPLTAVAHPGIEHVTGFMQGVIHPFTGIDHMLAMVAVGLMAGRLGGRATWLVPASFMTLMAVGAILGMTGVAVPFVEIGIATSILVFGLLLASGRDLSLLATMALVGFFALFHGHAHGSEAATDIAGVSYEMGLLAATAVLHAAGVVAAMAVINWNRATAAPLLRWSGRLVALGGVCVLTGWL